MLIEAFAFVSPRMTVATIVPEAMPYAPFASPGVPCRRGADSSDAASVSRRRARFDEPDYR
jgi:hypothetical protein